MANQETGAVATHDKTTFLEGALSVTAKLDSFLNQEVEGGRIPVTNTAQSFIELWAQQPFDPRCSQTFGRGWVAADCTVEEARVWVPCMVRLLMHASTHPLQLIFNS